MNGENNNFNNDELKKENENPIKSNETVEENSINYSAVSGSKEYIYGSGSEIYSKSENTENIENDNQDRMQAQAAEPLRQETETVRQETKSEHTVNEENKPKPKKRKSRFLATVALVLVVSLVSGTAGSFVTLYYYRNSDMLRNTNGITDMNKQDITINLNNETYFAAAVNEKTKNTVVGITTTIVRTYNSFWGGMQEQEGQSIGSGIIVDPNGLILTNSHVIGDGMAKKISVSLTDGTNEDATVLWYDPALDLAVIKINRTGLHAAELGDSDSLIVGEPVVAIGNPMSLELNGTLTTGVVSGLNRSITIENTTIKPLIQTNASINPGNSGGPLFNAKGQVIGINTAKMSTAEGLGFSIPINVAIPVLNQITNAGTVSSVYVGIRGTGVADYEQRLGIDLSAEYGVIAVEIEKDGPVYKAGLTSGDIIIAIDKTEIKDMSDLKRVLYKYKAGDKVELKYLRDGSEYTVEITLQEKPKDL